MIDISKYNTINQPTWCPGCGDYGILIAIKNALASKNIDPSEAIFVYDIGCNSNLFNVLKVHGFESLHGRPIPLAEGIKLAASDVPVFIISGDGGTYGEGGNHLIHAARRNINIKLLVFDNKVYGLTTGQASPTTPLSTKTKTTPFGNLEEPFNPLALTLSAGGSFIARGFAGDIPYLSSLITQAIDHPGFSLVNILQPCVTFNPVNSYSWYRERIYKLETTDYKPDNLFKALEKSYEGMMGASEKIPVGVLFKQERPTFEAQLPQIKEKPLRDQPIKNLDLTELFNEFK